MSAISMQEFSLSAQQIGAQTNPLIQKICDDLNKEFDEKLKKYTAKQTPFYRSEISAYVSVPETAENKPHKEQLQNFGAQPECQVLINNLKARGFTPQITHHYEENGPRHFFIKLSTPRPL